VVQDSASYDAIGRDVTDVTPLGQINTAYLGETNQISTITELGQTVGGSPAVATYSYLSNTGDRRLAGIAYNAVAAANEALTSDDAGRILTRTDGTGKAETYSYDAADRLIAGSVTAPTPSYTESYAYTPADFITSKTGEPTAANNWTATSRGALNQIGTLTPSGGAGLAYTYDADGNVLSDGVRRYTWDAENRLLSVTVIATGHVSSFTYDGLGRRVAIGESSGGTPTVTGYLWCGASLCGAYAGSALTALYEPEGEIQYQGSQATDEYYALDHLTTVTAVTGSTGATLGTLATDAYGQTLKQTGTIPTFGYAGMFLHQASGLYLTPNRAYDPYAGRWLSRDPLGEAGGLNLYGYAASDPVNFYDPSGLVVVFTGDAATQTALRNAYNSVGTTTLGAQLEKQLEDSKTVYTIKNEANGDAYFDPTTHVISVDPNFHPPTLVQPPGGCPPENQPAPTNVILGHEIGHAATGALDDGPNNLNNVNQNENPIRAALGLPPRIAY